MQQKASSFWGASPPDLLTRGSAPETRWRQSPQTLNAYHSMLAISPKPRVSG